MNSFPSNEKPSGTLIPIIRPTLPPMEDVVEVVAESYNSGSVTVGEVVGLLEEEVRGFTGASHAVAVSSCTSGLMLAWAALDLRESAEVIVPSFTFGATVQALIWNRLLPVFVDCLPGSLTIDPDEVRRALTSRTRAICPVTTYGLPPDIDDLENLAREHGLALVFDSAQGLGSTYKGHQAGVFGTCEVFSLSPTKVITAIEGGVLTTEDGGLAERIRSMRDYGKGAGGEEMVYNGLSARMSEVHAAVGLLSLRNAANLITSRLRLIGSYRQFAGSLRGCDVQEFPDDRTSSGNYFTLLVQDSARKTRDEVFSALKSLNIQSKRYFYPPVHAQAVCRARPHRVVGDLPVTRAVSEAALVLPLYSHMADDHQKRVFRALHSLLG